jgi:hypothetical protein
MSPTGKGGSIMSAPMTTATGWQWPDEVLAFAEQEQVRPYLDPLLEVTRQLFPTARSLRVYVETDHELRDVRWIIFDAQVPAQDVPDYLAVERRWNEESFRICPAPLICTIVLRLGLVS